MQSGPDGASDGDRTRIA